MCWLLCNFLDNDEEKLHSPKASFYRDFASPVSPQGQPKQETPPACQSIAPRACAGTALSRSPAPVTTPRLSWAVRSGRDPSLMASLL